MAQLSQPDPASESDQRVEPGSFNVPTAPWPATAQDTNVDADRVARSVVDAFNAALEQKDFKELTALFTADCFWRDHIALSWELRTLKGKHKIQAFLQETCPLRRIEVDKPSEWCAPQVASFAPNVKGIQFFISIVTEFGAGRGAVRLVQEATTVAGDSSQSGAWKIWTFFTVLTQLRGHEELVGPRRPNSTEYGNGHTEQNWLDRRSNEAELIGHEPDVLIIGLVFMLCVHSFPSLSKTRSSAYAVRSCFRRLRPSRAHCPRSAPNAQRADPNH